MGRKKFKDFLFLWPSFREIRLKESIQKTSKVDWLVGTTELMDKISQQMIHFRVVFFFSLVYDGIDGVKYFNFAQLSVRFVWMAQLPVLTFLAEKLGFVECSANQPLYHSIWLTNQFRGFFHPQPSPHYNPSRRSMSSSASFALFIFKFKWKNG